MGRLPDTSTASANQNEWTAMDQRLKEMEELALRLRDANVSHSRLAWAYYTTGFDFGMEESYAKIADILSDEAAYGMLKGLRESLPEGLDRRRAEIMELGFRPYHASPEARRLLKRIEELSRRLAGVLNTHRTELHGREVTSSEIARILGQEDDRQLRRDAWLARADVNARLVDGGFLELVKLRRELAEASGFDGFVGYQLSFQELPPKIFAGWEKSAAQVAPAVSEMRTAVGRALAGLEQVKPWDTVYVEGRLCDIRNRKVDLTSAQAKLFGFFRRFGFQLEDCNITYDLFPRSNKSEWGYNFPIETAGDSRILANVTSRYYDYRVLLHETGHAVHSFWLDPDKPILNMGVSGIVSEGIANLFGDYVRSHSFAETVMELDGDGRERMDLWRLWHTASRLDALRSVIFDQRLYKTELHGHDDILQLYLDTADDLGAPLPGEVEEPPWGFKIHHTTHPIYLHNYFMGDVTRDMLEQTFLERRGATGVLMEARGFGEFLREEVISPSGRLRYSDLYSRIAGEEFSLEPLLRNVRSAAEELKDRI